MMFKKVSLVFASCLLISIRAQAETVRYIPYLGLDYAYSDSDTKSGDATPEYHAVNVNAGTKYNRYFGTEVFYQQSFSDSRRAGAARVRTSYRSYGLDVAGYLPLGDTKLSLTGTAGIGEYVFRQKATGDKRHNNSGLGYRFGGGLIYDFTDCLSLRILIRHNELDKISALNYLTEYTAGLRYYFNKD